MNPHKSWHIYEIFTESYSIEITKHLEQEGFVPIEVSSGLIIVGLNQNGDACMSMNIDDNDYKKMVISDYNKK